MPPSPASRCSPGREISGKKKHRRGHSIENGILFRDNDEDLALFSELQDKERDGFLLQSSDDLEDVFSTKLKHFSEFTIPVQGESSRMLSTEGDKNDYDWLLTPPETPLFPSLDDEPQATSAVRRGRPQSQVSLSRSSTMEKRRRSSKGSASPNRLSTSPRADNIRGRPSSGRHASPGSGQRSVTPVRRISPTPSGPVSRSLTPTSRRLSTGSTTSMASPAVRGTSPVSSIRGNSASPKVKVWQSNIPGFSLDAPPNLRTSLGDRPASYVRGSSPASTRSRQSVSPNASRSVSSSHSHERDQISSHSKGSGDDDLQSIPVGGSERAVSKRASLSPNSRISRSSKLQSPSSAPRRPFESALRHMDHPKSHHSMFRPLASSLPSTGVYTGKSSSSYHHIMLRHSSATAESNSSSGQGTGFMSDANMSDPVPDLQSEVEKLDSPDKRGDITSIGMVSLLNEGSKHEDHESSYSDMDHGYAVECETSVNEEVDHVVSDVENNSTHGSLHAGDEFLEGEALETMEVCSRCGSHYCPTESISSEINICLDCREEHSLVETGSPETAKALDVIESQPVVMDAETIETQTNNEQNDRSYDKEQNHLQESSVYSASEEQELCGLLSTDMKDTQTQLSDNLNNVEIGSLESRSVPVLIKRSVSMKAPKIQGNNSSGFTRSYDGFSYLRNKSSSLRSSTGTTSASSSCDYGSSLRKGNHVRHQSDMETHRYDTTSKSLSSFEVPASQTHEESRCELQDSECKETNVIVENGFCENGDDVVVANTELSKVEIREPSELGASVVSDDCSSLYDHSRLQEVDGNESPGHGSATMTASEIEPESFALGVQDGILESECNVNEVDDFSEKSNAHASLDHQNLVSPVNEILDESTVTVECPGQKEAKSLTLEEATDTILFCSSIVHDIVYQATTIATDKATVVPQEEEEDEVEKLHPTVRVLGKSNAKRSSSGTKAKKQSSKPEKAKQTETVLEKREVVIENDENDASEAVMIGNVGVTPNSKGESLKPPPKLENKCNCSVM